MTWTTVCDLSLTKFQPGKVIDSTDFHNDAQILGSIVPNQTFVNFQNPDDQLVIPVKDDSLQRFTALNVEARIRPTSSARRLNIVEGWMSFAFFVESDRRLMATVYDGHNWVPVASGNTLVPLNQWSTVSFQYDGVCIGRLSMNGSRVGVNINMPMGMHQPQQNITIGHWPSGDGRYTFIGNIGHVRIERRDYEDFWRDAMQRLFCGRRLNDKQAYALKQLNELMTSLDERTREEIRECAKLRSEKLLKLFRSLRAGNRENIIFQARIGEELLDAWCCLPDAKSAKRVLLKFLRNQAGPPGSEQRTQFMKKLNELSQISVMCKKTGEPFDRMWELLKIVVPEIAFIQTEIDQLVEVI